MLPPNCNNKCSISIFNVNINKRAGQAEKTVDFKDQQSTWEYRMNEQPDPTFGNADTSDVPADFFERPVRIAEFEWTIGSTLFETLNPWELYFEEPRVANKMAHFRNLRCSLRLKFVLNGNPFYFGRVIAAVQPLPFLDNITKFEVGTRADFVQASQRPHVYLNPTTCEGGELVLPFFFYKNTLDITRAEWRDMGAVTVASMNPLRHANNAAEPVTISVFAMAESVNVSTPTSVVFPGILPQSEEVPVGTHSSEEICWCYRCVRAFITALLSDNTCPPTLQSAEIDNDSFVNWVQASQSRADIEMVHTHNGGLIPDEIVSMEPQSGEEPTGGDEYGMVSAPAHQVANLAGDLSNAPIIGPYARATQLIASGVARMAQLFGFSRPRVVEEPCSYLPRHAGHLAVTNVPDNIASLAVDAKKEVTIDGRVVGLDGMDEMALVPIACRESYLTTFDWSITDNPNDPLYSQRITPLMFDIDGDNYHLTPSAWTQIPFQYWKGSVEIRFKIVCSEYHRGRIRIVWDPVYFSSDYSDVYNVNYTEIIDISETRDFSVRIGWGQQTSYLPCGLVRDLTDLISPRALYTDANLNCNGAISVLVVNQLTTPASTEPIEINVYTKMCEDYEVAVPECVNLVDLQINDVPADFAGTGPIGSVPNLPEVPPPPPPTPPPPDTEFPFSELSHKIWFSAPDTSLLRIGGSSTIAENFESGSNYGAVLEFNPTFPGLPYTASVTLPANYNGIIPVTVDLDAVFFSPAYNLGSAVNLEFLAGDATTVLATLNSTIGAIRSGDPVSFNLFFDGNKALLHIRDIDAGSGVNHNDARIKIRRLEYPWPANWTARDFVTSDMTDWGFAQDGVPLLPTNTDAGGRPYILVTGDGGFTSTVTDNIASGHMQFIMDLDDPVADAGKKVRINAQDLYFREPDSTSERDIGHYNGFVAGPVGSPITGGVGFNYDGAPPFPVRLYGFMIVTEDSLVPEAGEEMIQDSEADEANAPIKSETEMYMAPISDSGQINSVHFGERITSWRQMLKRYNDVLRFTGINNTNIVMNDAEIDDPNFADFYPGFSVNPEMPLMRWVRSGYLARRGSIRYKALISAPNNLLKTASMSRVCQLDKVIGAEDNVLDENMPRISHAGSTFANVSETGVVDAEVPFYTNLRFQPSRIFQDYAEWTDRGKEYTWFQLNVLSDSGANLIDITQSASEDLSFHFFLSAPIINLKELPPP